MDELNSVFLNRKYRNRSITQEKKTLNLIQLLRGIASLLVLLLHTTGAVKEKLDINFFGQFFKFGGAGVDIFFVLSGFIITYTSKKTLNRSSNFITFLKKRFIRIFPVYWIVITAILFVTTILAFLNKTSFDWAFNELLYTYLLLPDHRMVNSVSWTLTYELYFYLIFSIAFLINDKKILIFLSLTYLIIMIFISHYFYTHTKNNIFVRLILFPMNIEFFMGILSALLIPILNLNGSKILLVLGIISFVISGVFSNHNYYIFSNAFNKVLLFGIPSFLMVLGVIGMEKNRSYKVPHFLLKIGEASYILYLIHLPLIVILIKVLSKVKIRDSFFLHLIIIALILIICIIGITFYNRIERPLINKLNKNFIK